MNCTCGAEVDVPEGGQAICTDCGRQNFSCGSCGAGIFAAAEAIVLACPYCDSPIPHADLTGKPMFFPMNLTDGEAREQLLRFLLNRFGIPGDFEKKYKLKAVRQVYVPIQLFSVTAQLSDSISEFGTTTVIQTLKPWYRNDLSNYHFAARVKQLMDPDKVRAHIYTEDLPPLQAKKHVEQFGKKLLARDKARFALSNQNSSVSHERGGKMFYPLYEAEYQYKGRTYRGVIDAASGVVCKADHPMSSSTRAAVLMAGMVMVVCTLVIAAFYILLAVAIDVRLFIAVALSLMTGLAASARIAWTAVRSHSSKEDLNARDEHLLDLPTGSLTVQVTERKSCQQPAQEEQRPPPIPQMLQQ